MYKSLGTKLQRATKVASHLHTGVIGNNNAILWTAVVEGVAGDAITVDLNNAGGDHALSVAVVASAIAVTLATAGGVIASKASDVIAAIEASPEANALVTVENDGASDGSGLVVDTGGPQSLANGSNTETYNTIAEVMDISGPSLKAGTMDTTNHDSVGGWREFVTTLKEGGEITCPINYLPQDVTQDKILGLIRDYRYGILRKMKVIFTDAAATACTFSAYVTGFSPAMPVEGKLSSNLTLKISGAVSW